MERKRTDHFADVKRQGTKYRKAKEIQSYQTSTTASARIVHLPTTLLRIAGESKKQDQTQRPEEKLKRNSHLLSQHSYLKKRIKYTWAGSNGSGNPLCSLLLTAISAQVKSMKERRHSGLPEVTEPGLTPEIPVPSPHPHN